MGLQVPWESINGCNLRKAEILSSNQSTMTEDAFQSRDLKRLGVRLQISFFTCWLTCPELVVQKSFASEVLVMRNLSCNA